MAKALAVFLLDDVPYNHLAATTATRECDDDRYGTVVAGHEEASHCDAASEADEASDVSEDWHLDDDSDEIDLGAPVLEYVREGQSSKVVTTCKKGPAWTSVFRIITEDRISDEVIEDTWIYEHDSPYFWRKLPKNKDEPKDVVLLLW